MVGDCFGDSKDLRPVQLADCYRNLSTVKISLGFGGKSNVGLDLNKGFGESDTENETCDLNSNERRCSGEFHKAGLV